MKTNEDILAAIEKFLSQAIIYYPQLQSFESKIIQQIKSKELKDFFQIEIKKIKSRFIDGKYIYQVVKESSTKTNKSAITNGNPKSTKKHKKSVPKSKKSNEPTLLQKLNGKIKKTEAQKEAIKRRVTDFKAINSITTRSSIWTVGKK